MLLLRVAKDGVFEVLNESGNIVIGIIWRRVDKGWCYQTRLLSDNINAAPQSDIDEVLLNLNGAETSDNKTKPITLSGAIDNMGL